MKSSALCTTSKHDKDKKIGHGKRMEGGRQHQNELREHERKGQKIVPSRGVLCRERKEGRKEGNLLNVFNYSAITIFMFDHW